MPGCRQEDEAPVAHWVASVPDESIFSCQSAMTCRGALGAAILLVTRTSYKPASWLLSVTKERAAMNGCTAWTTGSD